MVKDINTNISDELLAAYLEGNTTPEETMQVLNAICLDKTLQEVVSISKKVDTRQHTQLSEKKTLSRKAKAVSFLPLLALAANNGVDNRCDIVCEAYALRSLGLDISEEALAQEAIKTGWMKEGGMPLHHIGHLAASMGVFVTRRYGCQMYDIEEALEEGLYPIVAVDEGELTGDLVSEAVEDAVIGLQPDHVVVVRDYDAEKKEVTIFNPSSPDKLQVYPTEQFIWAWEDSQYYMVCIGAGGEEYHPHPFELDDVELPEELQELQEAIAENAHEIWAKNREEEGWIYGKERDDALKTHPDMVPYSLLPEAEKKYDRDMAMNTLKLLRKLGYDIVRRKE